MPGLHLLHACLPLAGSHSFWETAVYFSHPSPPCALELHGLTGTQCAATGEQNFILLSFQCCGHPGVGTVGSTALLPCLEPLRPTVRSWWPLTSCRVTPWSRGECLLQGSEVSCLLQPPGGEFWQRCFLGFCALVLSDAPKAAWGGLSLLYPLCRLMGCCLSLSARTCPKRARSIPGWLE